MKILVLDTAASTSGAKTILKEAYSNIPSDDNQWLFMVTISDLTSENNKICIINKWSKKSWIHRLLFDYIYLPYFVKKNRIDKILSLQNINIPFIRIDQYNYVHNSLPFSEKKYRFLENTKFWIYQKLIKCLIINSCNRSKSVFVQTKWMKREIERKVKKNSDIYVCRPNLSIVGKNRDITRKDKSNFINFFYPAMAFDYKNFEVIFNSVILLLNEGYDNFKILLTVNEQDKIIKQMLQGLDLKNKVIFLGYVEQEQVFSYYSESVVLFPSKIESLPCPLLEAKYFNSIVFAANYNYAKEALENYNNVYYFEADKPCELSNLMKKAIDGEIKVNNQIYNETEVNLGWEFIFNLITNEGGDISGT